MRASLFGKSPGRILSAKVPAWQSIESAYGS